MVVIVGVLSVAALPVWFNRVDFEQRGYLDELIQATRYAQKLAVATNCDVRINIAANGFALQRPVTWCNTAGAWVGVNLPGSPPPYNAPNGVAITAGLGTITFSASGLASADTTVTLAGSSPLSFNIHAATGYVER